MSLETLFITARQYPLPAPFAGCVRCSAPRPKGLLMLAAGEANELLDEFRCVVLRSSHESVPPEGWFRGTLHFSLPRPRPLLLFMDEKMYCLFLDAELKRALEAFDTSIAVRLKVLDQQRCLLSKGSPQTDSFYRWVARATNAFRREALPPAPFYAEKGMEASARRMLSESTILEAWATLSMFLRTVITHVREYRSPCVS